MAEKLNKWIFENYDKNKSAIKFGTFYPEDNTIEYVTTAVESFQFQVLNYTVKWQI